MTETLQPLQADAVATESSKLEEHAFRVYADDNEPVKNMYLRNHETQTLLNVKALRERYCSQPTIKMKIWDAMEALNDMVDESDPDTNLSQIAHAFQTAEAARKDNQPRWMQATCLIHDLGKVWLLFYPNFQEPFSLPQHLVVGDVYPVGCAFSPQIGIPIVMSHQTIVYPELFANNPDTKDPIYSTETGIYQTGCGLENVVLSFGHDEYLYSVVKRNRLSNFPEIACDIIRYHSFYAWHTNGAYRWVMNGKEDEEILRWVQEFNKYDLYSKKDDAPADDDPELISYYQELLKEFFPEELDF